MSNQKTFITGATSGIGLAIKKEAEKRGLLVTNYSSSSGFNLLEQPSIKKIVSEIKIHKPKLLFLNAGIASFGLFYENGDKISNIFNINTIANIKIISSLLTEIKSGLKIIVTLSTASFINGINEAVYNASKKALKEYIISVNTELEYLSINNDIFMFIPHKIKNTLMTSNKNLPTKELDEMIFNLFEAIHSGKNVYIPKYEIYKKVFKNYIDNPIKQGIESMQYRKKRNEENK